VVHLNPGGGGQAGTGWGPSKGGGGTSQSPIGLTPLSRV
jgi:hypothetical protein